MTTHADTPQSRSHSPLTDCQKENLLNDLKQKLRVAFAQAYAHGLGKGMSIEDMAKRADWSVNEFLCILLVATNIDLSDVGIFFYATDCDFDIAITPNPKYKC